MDLTMKNILLFQTIHNAFSRKTLESSFLTFLGGIETNTGLKRVKSTKLTSLAKFF